MKKYKKATTQFLMQFGNNIDFARTEIDKMIQYYERIGSDEKIEELFNIKADLTLNKVL